MKKAIQETLDIHHAANKAGISYVEYREFGCPLCIYSSKINNLLGGEIYPGSRCTRCPWIIFEGYICRLNEYNDYGASVARLTSWLEKC
jgi:hypothetical protein